MRRVRRWRSVRILRLALALGALSVCAHATLRSALEESVVAEGLRAHGWQPADAPEGKEIEEVRIYVLEVFDKRDPVPDFVNALHTRTRDWVVRQELLVAPGDRWEAGRILETERNLRRVRQISLANIVAARGSTPDKVRLLVVVKDVWSLRLNSDVGYGSSGLDFLLLNPAEENLAGIQISAGFLYKLERARQSFGLRFVYPRLVGTRYWVGADASFSTNNESGRPEGSSGTFLFQLPLYSRHRHWAFGAELAWNFQVARRYFGPDVQTFDYAVMPGVVERVPRVYQTERLAAEYWAMWSYGVRFKHDLSVGLEVDASRYRPEDLSAYAPATREAFVKTVLPVSDRRFSPYVQLRSYKTEYHRVLNMETLGLQEDIRIGHDALTRVYTAAESFGSSRSLVGVIAGASYTAPLGSGLFRGVAYTDFVAASEGRHEGVLVARFRLATPMLGVGRLHLDGALARRAFNYLNVAPYTLGGTGRLRGYPSGAFPDFSMTPGGGRDLIAMNAELRTTSVDILSAQVGLAAFLDAGDVPAGLDSINLKVGAGMGVRIVFPQADRTVLRVDWGLPLSGGKYEPLPGAVYATFGQAFDLPALSTPRVISGLSMF